jgi:hypothetical protein
VFQILNEIAGRTASKVVSWVVPQLMDAWDDDSVDVDRLLTKIIYGVMHHPAQREMGPDGAEEGRRLIFDSVREWWEDMDEGQRDEYRRKLSREGVENGENHREGQHDSGHGCGGKLKMRKNYKNEAPQTMEDRVAGMAADAIIGGVKQGFQGVVQDVAAGAGSQESGGLGGFISSVAGGILGGFGEEEKETYSSGRPTDDGGYTQTTTEYGRSGDRYGQAQYTETQYGSGGGRSEYRRYEEREDESGRGQGYGYTEERTETRYGGSGGYRREEEETTTTSYGGYGRREEETPSYGRREEETPSYGGYGRREEESSYGRRDEGESGYGRREEGEGYGGYGGREEESSYGGGYSRGQEEESYGSSERRYGGGRRDDDEEEEEERRRW